MNCSGSFGGNGGWPAAASSGAVIGGSGGQYLKFEWWKANGNIGTNTPMYFGAFDGTAHPRESTRVGTGMINPGDLSAFSCPCDGVIKSAKLALVSGSIMANNSVVYPASAGFAVFRNNYNTRTLLGIIVFDIPAPVNGGVVGYNSNVNNALMDSVGVDGYYNNLTLDISVKAGWYLGVEILMPSDNGAGFVQSADVGLWPGNRLSHNALCGFKNPVLNLQLI